MTVTARQVAASSVQLLAENVVRLVVVAAVSFWIARQLGPEQFGILNFATALVSILLSVASLGMDAPVILRLARADQPGFMGTVLLVRSAASVLAFGAALIIIVVLKGGDAVALRVSLIVSLCIVAEIPTVLDYWFKAKTMAAPAALARGAGTFIAAFAKCACLVLGLGVVALAWTVVLEAFATGLLLAAAYLWCSGRQRRQRWERLSVDARQIAPLLEESWPYMLAAVSVVALLKVDVVMLGYLSSNAETGTYSLAQKLSEALYIVPVVLIESSYPSLARRYLDANGIDPGGGQMLFDLAAAGALLATLAAVVLARPLIDTVFGAGYSRSVDVFYVHAWSCVAIAMNTARYRWMAVVGLQRFAPMVTALGLAVNVALNFMLIPDLGAKGAAIATLVSYFFSAYLLSLWLAPLRCIGRMQTRAFWPWGRLYRGARLWYAAGHSA